MRPVAQSRVSQGLVKTRLKRMQFQPGLIEGYLAKTGLDFAPAHPTKISRV